MTLVNDLVCFKNDWLTGQVDVQFPTAESVRGKELYLQKEQEVTYQSLSCDEEMGIDENVEICLVDFHRLTVMFAQLQSGFWVDEKEQAAVLEFFAQIILSEQHKLYLGFCEQALVFGALVTEQDNTLLISDIRINHNPYLSDNRNVAKILAEHLGYTDKNPEIWYNS